MWTMPGLKVLLGPHFAGLPSPQNFLSTNSHGLRVLAVFAVVNMPPCQDAFMKEPFIPQRIPLRQDLYWVF
jgi:hypothetical protein